MHKRSAEPSRGMNFITSAKRFHKIIAVIVAVATWQIAALLLSQELLLPAPTTVVVRLGELLPTADFWSAVLFSLLRVMGGYILGILVGSVLAALAARFGFVATLLWPWMSLIKATPVASFTILCLIWLSSAQLSVFIAFLMVLPIVYTNLHTGLHSIDPKLLEMAKVYRMSRHRVAVYITLPHLRPYLLSACGVSMGLAWKAGVAAEVIGIPTGSMGEQLYQAKVYFSSPDLFAWTLVVVLLSVGLEKCLMWLFQVGFNRWEGQ